MNKTTKLSLALTSVGLLVLSGCTATESTKKQYNIDKSTIIALSNKTAKPVLENSHSPVNNFVKVNRTYVDPNPLDKEVEEKKLPQFFKKEVTITMPGTVSAVEVLTELQRSAGIKFNLDKEVYDQSGGFANLIKEGGRSGSNKKDPILIKDFIFKGSLADALDLFTAKTALFWEWNGKNIEIFKFKSETYSISALSGTINTSSSVNLNGDTTKTIADSGSGGSAANGLSNTSSVTRAAKMALWDEIKTSILSVMSPDGSLSISESMGRVIVRDTPVVQTKVAELVKSINKNLTGQILLNVDIYELTVSDGDDVALDWTMAFQQLGKNWNVAINSIGGAANSGNSAKFNIVDGNFKGTSAMLGALSTLGKASVLNSFTVTTLSGQPAPIAVNRNVGYLKSMTRDTSTTGDSTSYSLEPGNVSLGVNINVKPKILEDSLVLLEYVMNLSDLERMRQITSPDNSAMIEVPTTQIKGASQIATLESGQTLVMSGFKQRSSSIEESGVGHSSNILLGGKRTATLKDTYLIVTVTPYIATTNNTK